MAINRLLIFILFSSCLFAQTTRLQGEKPDSTFGFVQIDSNGIMRTTTSDTNVVSGVNSDGSLDVRLNYLSDPDNMYNPISIQNPLPSDGDAVYSKDIWIAESDSGDFSGNVDNLFNNLHTTITNTTTDNPKEILIHFNRSVISNVIGLGAYTGNFSNVKVIGLLSGITETTLIDESSSDTKYTTRTFNLPATVGLNALKIQFHTSDTVSISNAVIIKTRGVVARLQAKKPDNTITDINATTGGNLKVSMEELESGISVNGNSQLRVTIFDSSGTKANVDQVSKSLQIIDYEHHEIHAQNHYFVASFDTLTSIGDTLKFCITTPDTTARAHVTYSFSGQLLTQFYVYEGGSCANGVSFTPVNNDRNSSNTSMLSIEKDATILSLGNLLERDSFGSGTNPASANIGFGSRTRERILKNNTTYILLFITGANNNIISYEANWYEDDD